MEVLVELPGPVEGEVLDLMIQDLLWELVVGALTEMTT